MLQRAMVLLVILSAAPLSADTLEITIVSDPAGASVSVHNGTPITGYAPVTIRYSVSKGFFKRSTCETLSGVTVTWVSGAEASVPSLRACPHNGKKQQIVFRRPTEVPGREIDAQFALELYRLTLMQQEAKQARNAARWQAIGQAFQDYAQRQQEITNQFLQRQLRCTSNMIGDTVYTNCY